MRRTMLSFIFIFILMCGVGCRTYRYRSTQESIQVDSTVATTLHRTIDSLYRLDLSGEIEWEWEQVDYAPDTLCDTTIPRKSVTRWRRALRVTNRQEARVIDTLAIVQSQQLIKEEKQQIRERRRCDTSVIFVAIAWLLILLFTYKLIEK